MQKKLDALRRVVIPAEFRKKLLFTELQAVEIAISFGEIHVVKFQEENWQTKPFLGIVRNLDALGRLCIPSEYLDFLDLAPKNWVNVELKNCSIRIQKI